MLRAAAPSGRNLLRARTLTNQTNRARRDRKARLRLDALESREQPGQTTDLVRAALTGGIVTAPLEVPSWVGAGHAFAAPPTAPNATNSAPLPPEPPSH